MTGAPPLILAIETSGASGSAALARGSAILAEKRFDPAVRGGSALQPGVVSVLEAARGAPIELVAVGIGPGSYTGTRIGLVFARTFAFARGVPLAGVCGLEAVAARVRPAGRVAVLMAANPGQSYGAVYECDGEAPPRVAHSPALVQRDAFIAAAAKEGRLVEMPPEQVWASDIAKVAALRAAAGQIAGDADAIEPLYLQPSAPERKTAS